MTDNDAPRITITREGDGAHKAGHVWTLRIDGTYAGTYETKRQATDAAEAARPAWTYAPENLPAAREAGYDVNDDDDDGPAIDRAAEENYRAHSSSVTGVFESHE